MPCDVMVRDGVATVTLNRPEIHNAFDEALIGRLTATFVSLDDNPDVRAVVLAGAGRSFCAGADLNWMKRMAAFGPEENLADAHALAAMLRSLYAFSKPTIARVTGAAYGGGVGLVAACDIAIAVPEAMFALTEAKLGLIPATIGPYVIEAIGARQARRYFLTAERFGALDALRIGLLHEVVAREAIDARIDALIATLTAASPAAQLECKALIRGVAHRPIDEDVIAGTAEHIAAVRASPEGREGVAAFLGKRPPEWVERTRSGERGTRGAESRAGTEDRGSKTGRGEAR
ncbi:MAG TPA: enoyl-CoA hydratase/isomerase family protein [Actinomycetota bacterium]|nr:enoyl-CoA hydratase/isomerase family protein [Actinomycetota bacterium]